jgi:hypothetical protein
MGSRWECLGVAGEQVGVAYGVQSIKHDLPCLTILLVLGLSPESIMVPLGFGKSGWAGTARIREPTVLEVASHLTRTGELGLVDGVLGVAGERNRPEVDRLPHPMAERTSLLRDVLNA